MSDALRVIPVRGLPEVSEGMKVGELIARHAELEYGDIVVISQKIVSKAEGQVRRLSEVTPSEQAQQLA
jgi:coenzyme F420-0:L-glutamate ligase/coenzyme F420-1:gamma-L-glutamate ligase